MLKSTLSRVALSCLIVALPATANIANARHANNPANMLPAAGLEPTNTIHPEANAPSITLQPKVRPFVKDYLLKNTGILLGVQKERGHYFNTIDKVFMKYGIPVEMKYLAVIESDLKTTARSRVGALGMWQLMPETARALGLKVNAKVDERKYAYKSTVAAAKYLNDLYDLFGDWLLVIAAYNSGPGYVYKAIKKSGSNNFWNLQYYLPTETRLHVKKFIATHYFFEGKGSLVTLTKSETEKHLAAVAKFNTQRETSEMPGTPITSAPYFQWVAVINNQERMIVIVKK